MRARGGDAFAPSRTAGARLAAGALAAMFFVCGCAGGTPIEPEPGGGENDASVGQDGEAGGSNDGATDGTCVCKPGAVQACVCDSGTNGSRTCAPDCMSFGPCSGCLEASTADGADASDGKADSDGAAGSGGAAGQDGGAGTGGSAGTAGTAGSAGTAGTAGTGGGCTSPAPEDKCPGVALALAQSGSTFTGSVTGGTGSLCSDYASTCGTTSASPDGVYRVVASIDGLMAVDTDGSTASLTGYDPVIYVRTSCGDSTSEVACNDALPPTVDKIEIPVVANTTYFVFIDGYEQTAGAYKLNVLVAPSICGNGKVEGTEQCDDGNTVSGDGCDATCKKEPTPPQDVCPGVEIALTGSGSDPRTGSAQGTTANAALHADYKGTCGTSTASRDVVYWVRPDVGGTMTVELPSSGTSYDSVLYIRSDCAVESSQLGCHQVYGNTGGEKLAVNVEAGKTYFAFVDGYNGANGAYSVTVKVDPAVCGNGKVEGSEQCDDGNTAGGDGCDAQCMFEPAGPVDTCPGLALTLTQSGFQWVATRSGTTVNLNHNYQGSCSTVGAGKDAVFSMSSGPGGKVTITLAAATTNFDSVLYVVSGACEGLGSTPVACNNKSGSGGDTVSFDAPPATDYWIFVDGYNNQSGNYKLDVVVVPPTCGNGILEGGEECDDFNVAAGDGCSPSCNFEPPCGDIAEAEPNSYSAPQPIPAQCKSFRIPMAAMPTGDADYFKVSIPGGTIVDARTYVGSPGKCLSTANTVLSLWKGTVPQGTNETGACTTAGWVQCNDTDAANSPCSALSHTVANVYAGEYVLKVNNYSGTTAIAQYGLIVMMR
jgi:cysteine-rich repeat protein